MADAVGYFEKIYNENQADNGELQYVDFDMCKELALDMDIEKGYEGISRAKDAAIKDVIKEDLNKPVDEKSTKQMISEVETKGLEKIERGLKNYSKNDLIQGLCEVIASRSCKAHEKELRQKDVERYLSSDSIERVRNNFGKKLELALKTISKDDFLKMMKSDNLGNEIASKVSKELSKRDALAAEKNNVKNSVKPQMKI